MFTPLTLPNGQVLPNRLCKAAMEENLCDAGQLPGDRLFTLYRQWASGGAGLLLTGNVMICPDALTGPGGVVLQQGTPLQPFQQWAIAGRTRAGRSGASQLWMQISHPGRQMYAALGEQAVAPSNVAVDIGKFSKLLAQPRALTSDEIEALIERFATTAALAEQAGFTGVQIHAAHGYLLSQFLSPLTNRRSDQWGGSLENRAQFLLRVVDAVRAKVQPGFAVAVKLNSADFQRGGFALADAKWVVTELNKKPVDLVELSGGSYESPAMQGSGQDEDGNAHSEPQVEPQSSTAQREAYFIDFARDIASVATMPIMVTGGITRLAVAEQALAENSDGFGVDVLGIARAMAFEPNLPNAWQAGEKATVHVPVVAWDNKTIASLAMMALAKGQLERLAKGRAPKPDMSPLLALIAERWRTARRTKRYKKWRQSDAG